MKLWPQMWLTLLKCYISCQSGISLKKFNWDNYLPECLLFNPLTWSVNHVSQFTTFHSPIYRGLQISLFTNKEATVTSMLNCQSFSVTHVVLPAIAKEIFSVKNEKCQNELFTTHTRTHTHTHTHTHSSTHTHTHTHTHTLTHTCTHKHAHIVSYSKNWIVKLYILRSCCFFSPDLC